MAQDFDSNFHSVIQIDNDVSFVLDSRDIEFANVPSEKSIEMSRKTYSKKHPLVYDSSILIPENEMSVNGSISPRKSILKKSPKCPSTSSTMTIKEIQRKRALDSISDVSKSTIPKKKRKEISAVHLPPSKINGRIIDKSKSAKISNIRIPSPDSDVQILDVIVPSPPKVVKKDSEHVYVKERNKLKMSDPQKKKNSKSLPSILKPCYPSTDDVPITEADIAPNIPSNSVIPDTSVSETNQDALNSSSTKGWVMTAATSLISSFEIGETRSAKKSNLKCSGKQNLIELQPKASSDKRPAQKRELKNLYANLQEIYWAKEKGFQQLINSADHRHSERITTKVSDTGKNLRRLKANSGNKPPLSSKTKRKTFAHKNSAKLALKKAKFGKPKPNLLLKKGLKYKQSLNRVSKRIVKKPIMKPNKQRKINTRSAKVESEVDMKAKTENMLKKKQIPASSTKIVKDIRNSRSKVKHSSLTTGKSNLTSALKKAKPENEAQELPKSSRKFVKKLEYTNEMRITRKRYGDMYSSSVQKGAKVRVELEPFDHTSLWNSSFCEAFSKYVIEQSSSQMESKSKESIKAMFEELMESWYQNQPEILKRKKPEEETLRSSVRQSECAFRYKEIVVKKHENYMQFILVPNTVKQNSLSIEAMRELRDAFLLAKKDPNCRAVLLNSSGTFFCTGIDLSQLIGSNKKQAAEEMAATIKDLVLTISTFTRPVVAAVNGIAVGFGVTLLTLCDVVLASDKATFCIPATRLGYLPEGAITLTLPQVVGSTVATELLLNGRRLTADQALRHGLVSEVLWHSNLMNEVIPRLKIIVSQPLQVMEATKTMVRCQLWDRLKFHMEREWRLLPPLWLDAQCQNNIKKALQTGWLFD